MGLFYRHVIRPCLFRVDSEEIHNLTLNMLGRASQHDGCLNALRGIFAPPELASTLWGLKFSNPIGLAAGMDKFGIALPAWAAMGFGFAEIGGVTAHPQPGNPAPRMFRVPAHHALINRMGFNNPGALQLATQLQSWQQQRRWPSHPIGINLGKSKITPIEEAAGDYSASFTALREHGDFFVVNVSSPNTPGLRTLQGSAELQAILEALQRVNAGPGPAKRVIARKPILIKIAPDLALEALDEIVELCLGLKVDGIVATNTTLARPATTHWRSRKVLGETGGLSGGPLGSASTAIIRHLYQRSSARIPIIGVGGIFTASDAWEKIIAGASLLQIYTGLVYEGPGVVREIVEGLEKRLEQNGFSHLQEAIGTQSKVRD